MPVVHGGPVPHELAPELDCPPVQVVHAVAPAAEAYFPEAQLVHVVAEAAE